MIIPFFLWFQFSQVTFVSLSRMLLPHPLSPSLSPTHTHIQFSPLVFHGQTPRHAARKIAAIIGPCCYHPWNFFLPIIIKISYEDWFSHAV